MCFGDDDSTKIRKNQYSNEHLNDQYYEGTKVDARLADGPFEKRKLTDCFCCIIFLVYCVGMGYVASVGLA